MVGNSTQKEQRGPALSQTTEGSKLFSSTIAAHTGTTAASEAHGNDDEASEDKGVSMIRRMPCTLAKNTLLVLSSDLFQSSAQETVDRFFNCLIGSALLNHDQNKLNALTVSNYSAESFPIHRDVLLFHLL